MRCSHRGTSGWRAKLWSVGSFSQDKTKKYAAIVYGFDMTELQLDSGGNAQAGSDDSMTNEEQVDARVDVAPSIVLRQEALSKGADDIRSLAQQLSTKRERYDIVKEGFGKLLGTLEEDANASALQEVRRTLEVLQPKQTKTLLTTMLALDKPNDLDDVLQDLLGIISDMPEDKLKKVFGEFKSPEEQNVLHTILVAIGKLDER
ncbi:MAG: hypothetical protein CMJ64_23585 [Planctomycetaceae bacterium]|nr:hypothetical protein [Planctomycetaceae bacterium]